jgi:ArsR family transcriptional regulator
METNVLDNNNQIEDVLAELFQMMGQPARLQILLIIGNGEACVGHMKAVMKKRQAYISQQLMILRDKGLVETTREGRNIYYRLTNPEILNLIRSAARIMQLDLLDIEVPDVPGCKSYRCRMNIEESATMELGESSECCS